MLAVLFLIIIISIASFLLLIKIKIKVLQLLSVPRCLSFSTGSTSHTFIVMDSRARYRFAVLLLVHLCYQHLPGAFAGQEWYLDDDQAPWQGVAWPPASVDDVRDCEGWQFCYKKGEKDKWDCDDSKDCFREGVGMTCTANCGWGTAGYIYGTYESDCCDYEKVFTDSSRDDVLRAAPAE